MFYQKHKTIILLIALIIVVMLLFAHGNQYEINHEDVGNIVIGMDKNEVIKTMNNSPSNCVGPWEYCSNTLLYKSGDDSNPYIKIKFENNKVKEVYIPKIKK